MASGGAPGLLTSRSAATGVNVGINDAPMAPRPYASNENPAHSLAVREQ